MKGKTDGITVYANQLFGIEYFPEILPVFNTVTEFIFVQEMCDMRNELYLHNIQFRNKKLHFIITLELPSSVVCNVVCI